MNTILFVLILFIWHPDGSYEVLSGTTYSNLQECAKQVSKRANQAYKETPDIKIDAACVKFDKEDAL